MRTLFRQIGATMLLGGAAATVLAAAAAPRRDANRVCISRLERLAFVARMYAEDYDNRLPPIKTAADVKRYLQPYVTGNSPTHPVPPEIQGDQRGPIYFCPATGLAYGPNPALSGMEIGWQLAKVKGPGAIWLLRDPKPHPDGLWTAAYLDGHAERKKAAPRDKK